MCNIACYLKRLRPQAYHCERLVFKILRHCAADRTVSLTNAKIKPQAIPEPTHRLIS